MRKHRRQVRDADDIAFLDALIDTLVRNAQAAPLKPVREVVDFWVKASTSSPEATTGWTAP
jgi:hypothetical protein